MPCPFNTHEHKFQRQGLHASVRKYVHIIRMAHCLFISKSIAYIYIYKVCDFLNWNTLYFQFVIWKDTDRWQIKEKATSCLKVLGQPSNHSVSLLCPVKWDSHLEGAHLHQVEIFHCRVKNYFVLICSDSWTQTVPAKWIPQQNRVISDPPFHSLGVSHSCSRPLVKYMVE